MEFIGFSGKLNEVEFDKIISIAELLGITAIENEWDYDTEVSAGLRYFTKIFNEDFLIQFILKNKEGKQTTTSNFLTEELNDFHITNSKSIFIEFIRKIQELEVSIQKMHIIFSSEWEDIQQNIRYIKCNLGEIENYFRVNNGWHLIFFSLDSLSYIFDFGCPLIFEVQSG